MTGIPRHPLHDSHSAEQLLAFLDIEQIDGDIYRGVPGIWPSDRTSLYGGEVAAMALRAAAHTVAADRLPHSLHGYFLRRGDHTKPVIFMVDRDRDGRSLSARRVAAMQGGEVIWEMACSFSAPVDGPEYVQPAADLREPETSPPFALPWCPILDIRLPPAPGHDRPRPMSVDRGMDPGQRPPPRRSDRARLHARVRVRRHIRVRRSRHGRRAGRRSQHRSRSVVPPSESC